MWTSDADEYEVKGFCDIASKIRAEIASAMELMLRQEIEAMKKRNAETAARHANKPSSFKPAKNIGFNYPSSVSLRRHHGISDEIGARF